MPRKGRPPKRQRRLRGGPPRKPSKYNLFIKRMTKGGKMTLKQAAARWRKGGRRAPSTTRAAPRRRAPSRAQPSGGRRMGKLNTQKIFKYVRLAALAMPAAERVMGAGSNAQKVNLIKRDYFGIGSDGNFYPHLMAKGWMPYLASIVATYGIPKLAGLLRSA